MVASDARQVECLDKENKEIKDIIIGVCKEKARTDFFVADRRVL